MKKIEAKNFTKGFSLIESLTVIFIISIMSATVVMTFANQKNLNTLFDGKMAVVRALEQARARALNGINNINQGAYLEASSISLFEGDDHVSGSIYQVINLPAGILSDQIGTNVVFSRLNGRASSDLTVTVTNSNTGDSAEINITTGGSISPN